MHAARYRIARRIKRGGTAEVLEAAVEGERGFLRKVALKRLLPGPDADPSFQRALIDEGRILSQLHHANIVSVFDFGIADEQPFLVMEWIDGDDLATLLVRSRETGQPVPAELCLHIATEVAHALSHAHRARDADGQPLSIVHRDVSPENILISVEGDVKLTDFGIAWARQRLEATKIGVAKGKRAYMAPEQLRGDQVDARTDLFSLGCTLHVMLTGRPPFEGDPALGTAIDPGLPKDMAAVIARAIRSSPRERYGSADEMAGALGALLAARLEKDPRSLLRSWIAPLVAGEETAPDVQTPRRGDLLDLELVLDPISTSDQGIAHYGTAVQPRPAEIARPAPQKADPLIGKIIGGHRIEALIGTGGSAKVYRAMHPELGRTRAIKLLATLLETDVRAISRLRQEAKALAQITHPNVVGVLDFGQTPSGQHYLVLELVPGPTLSQLMRAEGRFSPLRATRIAQQLARGLSEAHQHNLLHRDLKPGNIKVVQAGDQETVKILDFGLARSADPDNPTTRLTQAGVAVGTPRYMAPEQIDGLDASRASDLYALGVILYEMLSGAPAFSFKVPELIVQKRDPAPRLPPLDGLGPLVERLLDRSPERRPQTGEEVLESLDAIEETLSADAKVTAVAPSFVEQTATVDATPLLEVRREADAGPAIWIAALILMVGLALAAILIVKARERRPVTAPEAPALVAKPPLAPSAPPVPVALPVPPPEPPPGPPPETLIPEPELVSPKPRSAPRPPAPLPPVEPNPARLRAALDQTLTARGLSLRDLEGREPSASDLRALSNAEASKDPAAIKGAIARLDRDVRAFPIDAGAVKRKLARINLLLERHRDLALEKRYLDLRAAFDPDLDPGVFQRLMREAGELEGLLSR